MPRLLVLVGFAGALGTVTRYVVGLWAARALGTGFPFGTLIVNVVGCFLIAAITQVASSTMLISPTMKLALTTGFMGGLTTYSSFNLDTTQLLESRGWYAAAVNFGVTTAGCFGAGVLGFVVASRIVGR
jgi:CrcB protein